MNTPWVGGAKNGGWIPGKAKECSPLQTVVNGSAHHPPVSFAVGLMNSGFFSLFFCHREL
jgi:hypothetical protein